MVYIRADANPDIGMGHIMRCLSIADAMTRFNQNITFVLASSDVEELVKSRGYATIVLNSDYRFMREELNLWPTYTPDIVIVDSYYVTVLYLQALQEKIRDGKVVYIDDVAAFTYPVDVLVNYNVYGSSLDYYRLYEKAGMKIPKTILGPAYVPLREMFRSIKKRKQPEDVCNVLVSTGGSDIEHIALSIVKAKPKDYTYHLLVGGMNTDKAEIEKLASSQENIVLHKNVTDMKSLIISCDIAVSAAGSTIYEICACGVPLITYIVADNQILGAEAFEKLGFTENLGDIRRIDGRADMIFAAIHKLSNDYKRRCETGMKMQELIDGFGADRMVQEILRITLSD